MTFQNHAQIKLVKKIQKVLIVDDHPVVVEALRLGIKAAFPDFSVVTAENVHQARSLCVTSEIRCDEIILALIDLQLPDGCGILLINEIKKRQNFPVIAISGFSDNLTIAKCIKNGASGFVTKTSNLSSYIEAMRALLSNGQYFPVEYYTRRTQSRYENIQKLTDRQKQILRLIIDGKPNKVIASQLHLAEGTIRNQIGNLFDIFSVTSRTQLVLVGIEKLNEAGFNH